MTDGANGVTEGCVFVIFGGTGDLSRRKLLPALHALHVQGRTGGRCVVLGVATDRGMTEERYREIVCAAVAPGGDPAGEASEWAERLVYFQSVGAGAAVDYDAIAARIAALERAHGLPGNRAIYLALPPQIFPRSIRALGEAGLNRSAGWTRLVIEKPFGRDLDSARELNRLVHEHFDESQVYRIDHYLGKETVQNLLVFRFANAMFETLWNREHVESVEITVAETVGVEARAGYYEHAGALRDMVQNHLSQLLALVTMEVPVAFEPGPIRAEKIKALRSVRAIRPADLVLGQYEAGTVDGRAVQAYREEPGVAADSSTETFVALRVEVENWRWQGVPFYLRTGKRLPRRLTEIEVKFRRAPVCMFRCVGAEKMRSNTLLLTLQPDEGFSLFFDVKVPGERFALKRLPLHVNYSDVFGPLPEAYQTLLLDVMQGDQTLFVHADEAEAAWALYTPLLEGGEGRTVHPYPAGTWGPAAAASFWGEPPE